jgi:hypothetical protein
MNIVTILNAHENEACVLDTIDSIQTYVGDRIMLLTDGLKWSWAEALQAPVYKLKGFNHGANKAPYRNVALALQNALDLWDFDWLCYTEYDALFGSDRYCKNLELADQRDVWMLGNDGHVDCQPIPLVESMCGLELKNSYYLLGCCQFFSRKYLNILLEHDFFNRFLHMTSEFTEGYMPGYNGYDVSEHLYPSLCRHYGGNIGVFASYDENGCWHGAYQYFPFRWRPELRPDECFPEGSIYHPLKTADHPIRIFQKAKRHGQLPHE